METKYVVWAALAAGVFLILRANNASAGGVADANAPGNANRTGDKALPDGSANAAKDAGSPAPPTGKVVGPSSPTLGQLANKGLSGGKKTTGPIGGIIDTTTGVLGGAVTTLGNIGKTLFVSPLHATGDTNIGFNKDNTRPGAALRGSF